MHACMHVMCMHASVGCSHSQRRSACAACTASAAGMLCLDSNLAVYGSCSSKWGAHCWRFQGAILRLILVEVGNIVRPVGACARRDPAVRQGQLLSC